MAVLVLNRPFLPPLKFSDNRKFRLPNPPHRQAENRYLQAEKKIGFQNKMNEICVFCSTNNN
jgi:hypothetical protein